MCGLFGVFNSNPAAPKGLEGFIRDGFLVSQVRGTDSSGIFNIRLNRKVDYHKLPVNGTEFLNSRAVHPFIDNADVKAITVGHVRKATNGAVCYDNAHPFITPDDESGEYIIGVHNGGLTDWKTKVDGHHYDVDSEWALNHIAKKGIDAFKDFAGPYAFIWYDSKTPDVINVARNGERTLYYCWLTAGEDKDKNPIRAGSVALASEHGELTWLMARNRLPAEAKCFIFEEGYHYTFNIDDVTQWNKVLLPKKELVVIPPTKEDTVVRSHHREVSRFEKNELRFWRDTNRTTVLDKVKAVLKGPEDPENTLLESISTEDGLFKDLPLLNADGQPLSASDLEVADKVLAEMQDGEEGDGYSPPSKMLSLPRHGTLISEIEAYRAKEHKELGVKYEFIPTKWDSIMSEVEGTVIYDFGIGTGIEHLEAVFRGVDESTGRKMVAKAFAKIEGICSGIGEDARGDITYILTQPHIVPFPSIASAMESSAMN